MNIDLTLPMSAEKLIPHRPPMLLVDRLLSFESSSGVVEASLASDSILANSKGELCEVALVEMLAQGYATVKGYEDLINGKPVQEGYLVGIRRFSFSGQAYAGDKLTINIRTVGSFEGFSVVEGEIYAAEEIIASGSIKLWLVNDGSKSGA